MAGPSNVLANVSSVVCHPVSSNSTAVASKTYRRLCYAVHHEMKEDAGQLLKQWLSNRAKDEDHKKLLELASRYDVNILKGLLAEVTLDHSDLLMAIEVAVDVDNFEGVQALIAHSQSISSDLWRSPSDNRRNILLPAAEAGNMDVFHELMKLVHHKLETPDAAGNTPLLVGAARGYDLTPLINLNTNTMATNNDDETVLHIAARMRHPQVLEKLLVRADIYDLLETKASHNRTPLMSAVVGGCKTCVLLLVEIGADQEVEDDAGYKLPQLAVIRGHIDILELFFMEEYERMVLGIRKFIDDQDEINSLLHLAIKYRTMKCIQFLLTHGANIVSKCDLSYTYRKRPRTALKEILENLSHSEQMLQEVFNDCVSVDLERVWVDFRVLIPTKERRMAVSRLLYTYRENKQLLQHPLLLTFIRLEWNDKRYMTWYQLTVYLLYTLFMTLYVCLPENHMSRFVLFMLSFVLSIHVFTFSIPNYFPGLSIYTRIVNLIFTAVPPITTLIMINLPFNVEWASVAILSTWLSLPTYVSVIPNINHQVAMFHSVIKEMIHFSLVFIYIMIAFSLTFFVLYYERENNFRNFGQAFLYTVLVLLQGGMNDTPLFENSHNSTTEGDNSGESWTNYLTNTLVDLRFAGIISSLLFMFVCILALLNMLVGLAVRGSKELMDEGVIHHLGSKVQWLYEWEPIYNYVFDQFRKNPVKYTPIITLTAADISLELYNELRRVKVVDRHSVQN